MTSHPRQDDKGIMSVSANTLMCHNSLTPQWWCDQCDQYLLHLVNINKRGCFLAFKWELKECDLAQQLDGSPWNLTQSSSCQTPIESIYDWSLSCIGFHNQSVSFEMWQNQERTVAICEETIGIVAAKEVSVDAGVMAVLSKLQGIFSKRRTKKTFLGVFTLLPTGISRSLITHRGASQLAIASHQYDSLNCSYLAKLAAANLIGLPYDRQKVPSVAFQVLPPLFKCFPWAKINPTDLSQLMKSVWLNAVKRRVWKWMQPALSLREVCGLWFLPDSPLFSSGTTSVERSS